MATKSTFSAHAVAREASTVAGRPVTDKQIRQLARNVIGRFDKAKNPAYLSHDYTAAERTLLVGTFRKRASGTTKAKAKAGTVARKSARAAKVAAQVTPVSTDA